MNTTKRDQTDVPRVVPRTGPTRHSYPQIRPRHLDKTDVPPCQKMSERCPPMSPNKSWTAPLPSTLGAMSPTRDNLCPGPTPRRRTMSRPGRTGDNAQTTQFPVRGHTTVRGETDNGGADIAAHDKRPQLEGSVPYRDACGLPMGHRRHHIRGEVNRFAHSVSEGSSPSLTHLTKAPHSRPRTPSWRAAAATSCRSHSNLDLVPSRQSGDPRLHPVRPCSPGPRVSHPPRLLSCETVHHPSEAARPRGVPTATGCGR